MDFFPASCRLPPEWLEPPEAPGKGTLPLRPRFFQLCWAEEEEEAIDAYFCNRGTVGEALPRSAEEVDEDSALDGPAEDFQGIFGGCNVP